jgi:sulfite exporter TauE/SafE/copper chaperone CopZ/plastocyanin domain-containing protein
METRVRRTLLLRIGGMTCINCQRRIEKHLKNTVGVEEAEVSYAEGTARVAYNPGCVTPKELYGVIESLDYQVSLFQNPVGANLRFDGQALRKTGQEPGFSVKSKEAVLKTEVLEQPQVIDEKRPALSGPRVSAFRTAGTLIVVFALFIVFRHIGAGGLANAFPLAAAGMGYGMIFLIGLVTSVHCAAMCGGINLSQCLPAGAGGSGTGGPAGGNRGAALVPSLLYNGGRVLSYTLVGAAVGALGSAITFTGAMRGIVQLIAGVFMILMGINMLGFFPVLRKLTPRLPRIFTRSVGAKIGAKIEAKKAGSKSPFFIGLLNGLMPCGPLQAMQLYALSTGSPAAGALAMFLFSLGTAPLMFFIGALSSILSRRFTAVVMRAGAVLVAVLGLTMFSNGLSLSGFSLDSLNPGRFFVRPAAYSRNAQGGTDGAAPFQPVIENGVQVVNSTLSGGRYPAITVQAGIPVRWIINAPAGSINGCNNRMIIREYGIEYQFKPGENIVEFTPARAGNFSYSCWMGMIRSSITVTAGGGQIDGTPAEPDLSPAPAGVVIPTDSLALASFDEGGDVQEVRIDLRDSGFDPAVIVVQRSVSVQWIINNDSLDEGNNMLVFPLYYTRLPMDQGDNVIGFMPTQDFEFSTADNIYYGYVKVVDDLRAIDPEAIKKEAAEFETLIYPEAWFDAVSQAGGGCCAAGAKT